MAEATPATTVPNARLSGSKRKKLPGSHSWDSYLHKVLQDNHPGVKITKEAGNVEKTQDDKFAESSEANPLCVESLCIPASKCAFTVVIRILGYSCCLKYICTNCLKIRQSVLSGIMWS